MTVVEPNATYKKGRPPVIAEFPGNTIQIEDGKGRMLWELILDPDTGSLRVRCAGIVSVGGKLLSEEILVRPCCTNTVELIRPEYNN